MFSLFCWFVNRNVFLFATSPGRGVLLEVANSSAGRVTYPSVVGVRLSGQRSTIYHSLTKSVLARRKAIFWRCGVVESGGFTRVDSYRSFISGAWARTRRSLHNICHPVLSWECYDGTRCLIFWFFFSHRIDPVVWISFFCLWSARPSKVHIILCYDPRAPRPSKIEFCCAFDFWLFKIRRKIEIYVTVSANVVRFTCALFYKSAFLRFHCLLRTRVTRYTSW